MGSSTWRIRQGFTNMAEAMDFEGTGVERESGYWLGQNQYSITLVLERRLG